MRAKSLQSCLTCATPWTGACQAPPSVGFSRQEHWSGLPSLPPGDLPGPGMGLTSLLSPALAGRFFTSSATWEAAQRLRKQESDNGWLTTCYYICCVSSTTSAGDSIWGHTLIQTTPWKSVLVTDTWTSQVTDTCLLPASAGDIEMQVQSLGQEDPLEEGTATHFSLLAWGIQSWTEEPGRLQSLGSQRVSHYWSASAWSHDRYMEWLRRCFRRCSGTKGGQTQVSRQGAQSMEAGVSWNQAAWQDEHLLPDLTLQGRSKCKRQFFGRGKGGEEVGRDYITLKKFIGL